MATSREEFLPKIGTVFSVLRNWFVVATSDLEEQTAKSV